MTNQSKSYERLSERIVLIGLGFGAIYWLIETFLYIFLSSDMNFFSRLCGPGLVGVYTRVIVLCLFLIFGSHIQYTLKKRQQVDTELEKLIKANEQLQREVKELKENRS